MCVMFILRFSFWGNLLLHYSLQNEKTQRKKGLFMRRHCHSKIIFIMMAITAEIVLSKVILFYNYFMHFGVSFSCALFQLLLFLSSSYFYLTLFFSTRASFIWGFKLLCCTKIKEKIRNCLCPFNTDLFIIIIIIWVSVFMLRRNTNTFLYLFGRKNKN